MPSRFRKRPVVIDAMRWSGNRADWEAISAFCPTALLNLPVSPTDPRCSIRIPTLEGEHDARPGDWIICGIAGEFYPCVSPKSSQRPTKPSAKRRRPRPLTRRPVKVRPDPRLPPHHASPREVMPMPESSSAVPPGQMLQRGSRIAHPSPREPLRQLGPAMTDATQRREQRASAFYLDEWPLIYGAQTGDAERRIASLAALLERVEKEAAARAFAEAADICDSESTCEGIAQKCRDLILAEAAKVRS